MDGTWNAPTTLTFAGCVQLHQAWFLKMATVRYPSLYQMNTRVWLTEFSRSMGRPCSLDDIPDSELDYRVEVLSSGTVRRKKETHLAAPRAGTAIRANAMFAYHFPTLPGGNGNCKINSAQPVTNGMATIWRSGACIWTWLHGRPLCLNWLSDELNKTASPTSHCDRRGRSLEWWKRLGWGRNRSSLLASNPLE